MLSYPQAIDVVLQTLAPLPPVEVDLADALGRVLAAPIRAAWDLPMADNSAMDGFAFACAGQTAGSELPVVAFLPAGKSHPDPVPAGGAVRIMTGAPIPRGCDTVIPVENVEELVGAIRFKGAPQAKGHVRYRGEEFRQGEEIIAAGTLLRSGAIGLLASAGISRVAIHPAPRVALISTGDELVELGQVPGPGQIVNSNSHLLAARLREEGCSVLSLGIARDHPQELRAALQRGLEADLLITSGGVSVGDHDFVQATLGELGFKLGFWKVAIKPGKPVLFGTVEGTPIFGLPGNPAASAATFDLFVRPALRRLAGVRHPYPPRLKVTLTETVNGGGKRQSFVWGALAEEGGRYLFTPFKRQGSGQNRSLAGADALLPMAVGSPDLEAGQKVEILLFALPQGRS